MLSLKTLRGDKDESKKGTETTVSNEDTDDVVCGIKDISINDDTAYVTLSGDIDATTSPTVTGKVKETLENDSIKNLIFDLKEVRYLSSAGLRSFVEIQNICLSKEIDFKSIELSEKVYRLFKVTGFGSMLKLEMTEDIDV